MSYLKGRRIPPARNIAYQKKSMFDLTKPCGVVQYLDKSAFRATSINRILAGTTNYVYRIHLDNEEYQTAILKYCPPYIASEPSIPFSSDRSSFEASALLHVPWKSFSFATVPICTEQGANTCARVHVPRLYQHDRQHNILISEDCSSSNEGSQNLNMLRQVLSSSEASPRKNAVITFVGAMLGTFVAQLQLWGLNGKNHDTALRLFQHNESAKNVIIQETFTDFFTNLAQTGYTITSDEQCELEVKLKSLQYSVTQNPESVCMGDLWSGNVLLDWDDDDHDRINKITIIDWEFVTMAPTFVDVGNVLRELFMNNHFASNDFSHAIMLESFMGAYSSFGIPLAVRDMLGFVGARSMWSLARRVKSPTKVAHLEDVSSCVKQCMELIMGTLLVLEHDQTDPFRGLVLLMKERAVYNRRRSELEILAQNSS